MKITKYIHSCLLIEIDGKNILIDPGNYSYESKTLDINSLDRLDYLLITHEHPDHMYSPFIKEIIARFPNLTIITNPSAKEVLIKESMEATIEGSEFITTKLLQASLIKVEEVPHERVFGTEPPQNVLFNVGDILTHPGDCLHFTSHTPVLALPVQAPWGSLTQAVKLAVSLKPEVVLPIHDWHWNETAREAFYKRLETYFATQGIKFVGLQTGEKVTI